MCNYCLFHCFKEENFFDILKKISDIIIPLSTLFLSYYVLIYQKRKDKNDRKDNIVNQNKSVKLQWFKEIIIQPRIDKVFDYFELMNDLKNKIDSNDLSVEEREKLLAYIKLNQSELRKSFLEIIQNIDTDLYNELINHIDILTDKLTEVISNDEHKLCNSTTYSREIQTPITEAYNNFLATIFNYKG